jgi:hypothetical protein
LFCSSQHFQGRYLGDFVSLFFWGDLWATFWSILIWKFETFFGHWFAMPFWAFKFAASEPSGVFFFLKKLSRALVCDS